MSQEPDNGAGHCKVPAVRNLHNLRLSDPGILRPGHTHRGVHREVSLLRQLQQGEVMGQGGGVVTSMHCNKHLRIWSMLGVAEDK